MTSSDVIGQLWFDREHQDFGSVGSPGRTKGHGVSPSRGMTRGRGGVRIARIPSKHAGATHMSRRHRGLTAALAVAGSLALSSSAVAGQAPPLPTAANGATVERIAGGLATPTSFAFTGDTVFAGIGPAERGHPPTGLMTVANGSAKKVPGTAPVVFGLAWHNDRLFVSSGDKIISYRGWNGTRFAGSRVVRRASSKLPGFNGLAFGPNGRLYVGVSLNPKYDHSRNPAQYANTVLSMRATGADVKIVARGLRQPFQLTFPAGATSPYV